MSSFVSLSAAARAAFALWALLLCLSGIGCGALSAVRRRYGFFVLSLLLFAPAYFLWQVIFDLSLSGGAGNAAGISRYLGAFPWAAWTVPSAALTVGAVCLLLRSVRFDRTLISRGTVKRFLDRVPCGVCCWKDSGRVLFSNVCMNRLCEALTGGPLLNGNALREAVTDPILPLGDRVWRFSCREFSMDGERLQELVASDVTAEYARTQALERDRAELVSLNRALQAYYRSIDDMVRRREILRAKTNIHDEMNRLMLSTTAADGGDTAAMDRIFSLWEQNALLLCMEAENTEDSQAQSLDRLVRALGVRLDWRGALPETLTGEQRSLCYAAAREAAVNAVKHAGAKTLTVSFSETETAAECRFTNDGPPPSGPVRFTGGLANLSEAADRQGASVSVRCDPDYTLILRFPRE